MKIFYSWQSDLPNATNRGLIEAALELAVGTIRSDDSIQIDPVVDRDTFGVPGAPDIAATIFDKIEQAAVFVCDVSIINHDSNQRLTPNPNVLIELGYALKALSHHKILMVMNTAFGRPDDLPFDLRMRRVITYEALPEEEERSTKRRMLGGMLERGLRTIISGADTQLPGELIKPESVIDRAALLGRKLNFKSERSRWMESERGVAEAKELLHTLFDIFESLAKQILSNLDTLHIKVTRDDKHITLFSNGIGVSANWHIHHLNTLADANLSITLFEDAKGAASHSKILAQKHYVFDKEINGQVGWRERSGDKTLHLPANLAEEWVDRLVRALTMHLGVDDLSPNDEDEGFNEGNW